MARKKADKKADEATVVHNATQTLVKKVWGFCHTLRDDGVGASEYLEQLTYLLFLKMIDELGKDIPAEHSWPVLRTQSGSELSEYYTELLTNLAKRPGMVGQIFYQAKNSINKPATLARLVDMIDKQTWTGLDADLKGELYEEILEKTASDKKSGAGQYFTPRALIEAIVECVRPEPGKTICDPASGTGGFLLKAYAWIVKNHGRDLDVDQKRFLKRKTFFGNEIVPTTRRLCLMNMYLHNIGELDGTPAISADDSLIADTGARFDYVITNPPFGTKSAQTITNDEGEAEKERANYNRQDFWMTTSNKQLNFVQHIHTILKTTGQAAVVLPDDVLFKGGAGEIVRRKLMETMELHTILRLPTGIFYAPGIKANVLFFDARPASKTVQTRDVWVYDYRTNIHHTLKKNPLTRSNLQDFINCYNPINRHKRKETWGEANPDGRWRRFTYEEILARSDTNLDFKWIKDDDIKPDDYSITDVISALSTKIYLMVSALGELKTLGDDVKDESRSSVDLESMTHEEVVLCARSKILDLAIRGGLVEQHTDDEPADALLARIRDEKAKLIKAKKIKKEKPLLPVEADEKLFDLPQGWTWCRIGDIFQHNAGKALNSTKRDGTLREYITTSNVYWEGIKLDVLKQMPFTDDELEKCTVRKGDLLICEGGDIGRSAIWELEREICIQNHLHRLRPYIHEICAQFYNIVLRDYKYTGRIRGKGIGLQGFSSSLLHNLPVPLPPFAEQKRIVAKVEALLAACEKLKGAGA